MSTQRLEMEAPLETKEEEIESPSMVNTSPPPLERPDEQIPVSVTQEVVQPIISAERVPPDVKRNRKMTEKGEIYQKELLDSHLKKSKKAIETQLIVIERSLAKSETIEKLKCEDETLDKMFNEFLDTLARLRDLAISEDERNILSADVETIDANIFAVKRKLSHFTTRHELYQPKPPSTISKGSNNGSTKSRKSVKKDASGSSQSSSHVRQKALIADLEAKRRNILESQDVKTDAEISIDLKSEQVKRELNGIEELNLDDKHKSRILEGSDLSKVSGTSHSSTRSSVKQKALIAGLKAKQEAMKKTHEAEGQIDTIKAEIEVELAMKTKAAQQNCELLRIEEQIAKAKAMRQLYKEKEAENNSSRSSRVSHTSRISNRSSIAQDAIIAGLKAESDAKRNTQNAEIQVEQLKLEAATLMARKLKEQKQKVELLKLEEQICEAKAIENIYRNEKSELKKGKTSTNSISTADKGSFTKLLSKNENNQLLQSSATASVKDCKFDNRDINLLDSSKDRPDALMKQMNQIVKMQAAPEVEIDTFSGNPLEYTYFIKNFKDIIESTVDTQSGRLNRLIKYTAGEAKELVKLCSHDSSENCYDNALESLEREYGNKFKIACAFMEELRTWPVIKQNDASAYRKFHRFLLKCLTLQRNGELKVLDSPLSIRQIQLKLPTTHQDRWSKIVEQTRRNSKREATFKDFVDFVDFESSVTNDPVYSRCVSIDKKPCIVNASAVEENKKAVTYSSDICIVCHSIHDLDKCDIFLKKTIDEKKKILQEQKLCFACYGKGHISRGCTSRKTCSVCHKSHPTAMHVNLLSTNFEKIGIVAMCIIPVMIRHKDNPDKEIKVYAIIDNCSQGTFGTDDLLLNELGIMGRHTSLTIGTAIGKETVHTFAIDGLHVRCTDEHRALYPESPDIKLPTTFTRSFLPADKSDIATKEKASRWKHLQDVAKKMADYDMDIPIGLLVGLNCPRAHEPYESVHGTNDSPYAYRNALGWCIMGPVRDLDDRDLKCNRIKLQFQPPGITENGMSKHHFAITEAVKDNYVSDRLREMWISDFNEAGGEEEALSFEDKRFIEIMTKDVTLKNGKYELPLPFRESNSPVMPESRQQARSRIRSVKRRMQRDKQFKQDYISFMENIIAKGYARKCENGTQGSWYIPHHGVYHPAKNKIRVVFDCSAKNSGISLNSVLLQGPDFTNSLVGVLMRFRLERIGIMGDIEAMYHQVKVPERHREYLRFLWWPNGEMNKEPNEYEMCVHLFGAISSPSCANFALRQAAIDNTSRFGIETADILKKDFYVDDLLKSKDGEEDTIEMLTDVQEICALGGFNLTKFTSNNKKVIESIPISKRSPSLDNLQMLEPKLPIERALGVSWCIELDAFQFRINLSDTPLTRRGILSSISSIYDPLGLVSPFLLKGRKILQEITSERNLSWDDTPNVEHIQSWNEWRRNLLPIEKLKISRCYKPGSFGESVSSSLHCFSDASKTGYGAACYLRQINTEGQIHVALVMGKSRVSPLKPTTIPRLELTGSTVAARIGHMVKQEISIANLADFYWTDSQIVLGYIYNDSRRFRTFVANRTQLIRDLTEKEKWRYIDTERNPADSASRGLVIDDETNVHRWFQGPEFLWLKEEVWNIDLTKSTIIDNDPEIQQVLRTNTTNIDTEETLLDCIQRRISNWNKMKRVLATMLLFIKKCRRKDVPTSLMVEDIEEAGRILIRMAQEKCLNGEIKKGKSSLGKKKQKWLLKLDPFTDDEGLLRVGGRLKNSEQPNQIKFPIILPKKGAVTQRIIEWFHKKVQHSGRSTTTNEIRSNGYWVLGMTSRIKLIIHSCVRCRILRGKISEQKMANLPTERTLEVAPFSYSGVDMFGPFSIKEGRKVHKRYCALFTCFSSRAVHLETTNKIDTDSFILALRRFLSTRGRVRTIRSDNGGNFVGASNEFKKSWKEMDHSKVTSYLQTEMCDWINWDKNTPNASHMGGVWERQIRTVRSILASLLKSHDQVLNDESFNTLIKEVEGIVNSRPLAVENVTDPSSQVLTPNHLLTFKSKAVLPPPGVFQKDNLYCRKRWRVVQHLANEFWVRWRKEYLASLQTRQKWTNEKRNFQVGDVVLLKEENISRNNWPIARIDKTFPSDDGLVRTVELRVADHASPGRAITLKRPISKVVLLCENETDSSTKKSESTSE